MNDNDTAALQSAVTADETELDERAHRALTEKMTVLADGADLYRVTTESGREYVVDVRDGRCTCPDHEHRHVRCKHLWRTAFATGTAPLPAGVDADAVDPLLGQHVDDAADQEPAAVPDGGDVLEADDDEEDGGEEGLPASADCDDCILRGGEIYAPCFEHYQQGVAFGDDVDTEAE